MRSCKITRYLLVLLCFLSSATLLPAQTQPAFKGGQAAFDNFIGTHLMYPEFSRMYCIAAVIRVGFSVDEKGKVYNVRVEQGPGIDLDDEAVRVIRLTSGKWIVPDGYKGGTRLVLPVRFTPDYTRCGNNKNIVGANNNFPSMDAAITAYHNRQELENAVTNYYTNKYKGTANEKNEDQIIALKKQLGIDDDFLNSLLEQANNKLQQGDNEGACKDWTFIRNTGSNMADSYLSKYCK